MNTYELANNVKTLNGATKKAQAIYNAYYNALWNGETSLRDVYGSFSYEKERAEKDIINEMYENGGQYYAITSYCTCFFTCAYRCTLLDKDGIYRNYLIYHTPSNVYKVRCGEYWDLAK